MAADMTTTDKLAEALRNVLPFVITEVLEHCNGAKCREQWCAGCMGEEEAEMAVEKSRRLGHEAYTALAEYDVNPGGWLPMGSAPRDGRRILCVAGGRVPYIGYHHIDDGWLDESESFRNPRFWQPLPPPPKEPQS